MPQVYIDIGGGGGWNWCHVDFVQDFLAAFPHMEVKEMEAGRALFFFSGSLGVSKPSADVGVDQKYDI